MEAFEAHCDRLAQPAPDPLPGLVFICGIDIDNEMLIRVLRHLTIDGAQPIVVGHLSLLIGVAEIDLHALFLCHRTKSIVLLLSSDGKCALLISEAVPAQHIHEKFFEIKLFQIVLYTLTICYHELILFPSMMTHTTFSSRQQNLFSP